MGSVVLMDIDDAVDPSPCCRWSAIEVSSDVRNTTLTRHQQWTFTALVRCVDSLKLCTQQQTMAVVNISQMKNIDRLTDWQVVAFVRLNATYQYVRRTAVARYRSQSLRGRLRWSTNSGCHYRGVGGGYRFAQSPIKQPKLSVPPKERTRTIVINIFNIYCRQSKWFVRLQLLSCYQSITASSKAPRLADSRVPMWHVDKAYTDPSVYIIVFDSRLVNAHAL